MNRLSIFLLIAAVSVGGCTWTFVDSDGNPQVRYFHDKPDVNISFYCQKPDGSYGGVMVSNTGTTDINAAFSGQPVYVAPFASPNWEAIGNYCQTYSIYKNDHHTTSVYGYFREWGSDQNLVSMDSVDECARNLLEPGVNLRWVIEECRIHDSGYFFLPIKYTKPKQLAL